MPFKNMLGWRDLTPSQHACDGNLLLLLMICSQLFSLCEVWHRKPERERERENCAGGGTHAPVPKRPASKQASKQERLAGHLEIQRLLKLLLLWHQSRGESAIYVGIQTTEEGAQPSTGSQALPRAAPHVPKMRCCIRTVLSHMLFCGGTKEGLTKSWKPRHVTYKESR